MKQRVNEREKKKNEIFNCSSNIRHESYTEKIFIKKWYACAAQNGVKHLNLFHLIIILLI